MQLLVIPLSPFPLFAFSPLQKWRKRVGIEPTRDGFRRPLLDLKSRRPTRTYPPPLKIIFQNISTRERVRHKNSFEYNGPYVKSGSRPKPPVKRLVPKQEFPLP